jgi:hypothetical protein
MTGSPKYRNIQSELDKKGIYTKIIKLDHKKYAYIVDFQIVAIFKKRHSANKRIMKLNTITP